MTLMCMVLIATAVWMAMSPLASADYSSVIMRNMMGTSWSWINEDTMVHTVADGSSDSVFDSGLFSVNDKMIKDESTIDHTGVLSDVTLGSVRTNVNVHKVEADSRKWESRF